MCIFLSRCAEWFEVLLHTVFNNVNTTIHPPTMRHNAHAEDNTLDQSNGQAQQKTAFQHRELRAVKVLTN